MRGSYKINIMATFGLEIEHDSSNALLLEFAAFTHLTDGIVLTVGAV